MNKVLILERYVLNLYPYLPEDFIIAVFKKNNFDMIKFYHDMSKNLKIDISKGSATFEDKPISISGRKIRDLQLVEKRMIETEIKLLNELKEEKLSKRKKFIERQLELEICKNKGSGSFQCPVCCEDFFLSECVFCENNHGLCKKCLGAILLQSISDAYGVKTTCVQDKDCPYEYPYDVVCSAIVDEHKLNNYWEALKQKNIVDSKIDYHACPSCQWGCRFDPAGKRVFYCRRLTCMKNWCLICGKEGHGVNLCPKEKEESEAQLTDYVAEAMTAAALKTCPHCQKPIRKTDGGCNHITCVHCRKEFCYLCIAKLNPPSVSRHFNGNHPQYDNASTLSADNDRIRDAGIRAADDWRRQHPNFRPNDIANRVQRFIDERIKGQ